MTQTQLGRTTLFLAPPATEGEQWEPAPRRGEEAMRRLRNPFRATDTATASAGHATAAE